MTIIYLGKGNTIPVMEVEPWQPSTEVQQVLFQGEGGTGTHLWPFSKTKFNLKSDRVNLVAQLSVCFIYPMSGRYNTNWDRKSWPSSEIQMYYGCSCGVEVGLLIVFCFVFKNDRFVLGKKTIAFKNDPLILNF